MDGEEDPLENLAGIDPRDSLEEETFRATSMPVPGEIDPTDPIKLLTPPEES